MGRLFETNANSNLSQTTTQFLYDGDALVAEYDDACNMLHRYVHGSGVDEPMVWYIGATVGAATRSHLRANWQGSITAVTDASGDTQWVNGYDPYGIPNWKNAGRFQYTGQIEIPELEMYYYKARMYSPTMGRFLQTDPIGYEDQVNLYAYVGNDPVGYVDPSGEMGIPGGYQEKIGKEIFNFIIGDTIKEVSDFIKEPSITAAATVACGVAKPCKAIKKISKKAKSLKRRGKEFTPAQKRDFKKANADKNDGKMTCKDCKREDLQNVKNEKGQPTPDNQAQVHHDPAIKDGGGRDSDGIILCPKCHQKRHKIEQQQ